MITDIQKAIDDAPKVSVEKVSLFFKTHEGFYGAHDRFLGLTVPVLRKIAKGFKKIDFPVIQHFLKSPYNEVRFLALLFLVDKFNTSSEDGKKQVFNFYLDQMEHVNNWNLVDTSAHLIIGQYLSNKDKTILYDLSLSKNMWFRRISIVSTWHFIKENKLDITFDISKILITDSHDLIHKACGWMLREAGKKNKQLLCDFLTQNAPLMPRTMLRYSLEKFDVIEKKYFMTL